MLINSRYHVTYCTNIHPGQDWQSTFQHIQEHLPSIKDQLTQDNSAFGLGLRLSNKASEELDNDDNLIRFKKWLSDENIYVFTMNGFPYGNFHNERVKDNVYAPDWTTAERVAYTKRLFDQLAFLIPEGISGGISTLPISYKHWHKKDQIDETFKKAAKNLAQLVIHLSTIEQSTGKYLHLDIEPEPDCLLENSDEFIEFYESYLVPIAKNILQEALGVTAIKARELVHRYITICYDICHFSLAYEEPADTFKKLSDKGIAIGKIQVSAALKILYEQENIEEIWKSLARFDEPTYLHQVTEKIGNKVRTYNDLPLLLQEKKEFTELRAHFHVPIFLERFESLYSTQDHILKVLAILKNTAVSNHLEVETYTWEVLPQALKMDLTSSIVRELSWLNERL